MRHRSKPENGRGPLARVGYCIKRTAIFIYGPADLPDDVDPITQLDRKMGVDTHPHRDPHESAHQRAYNRLPRSQHE